MHVLATVDWSSSITTFTSSTLGAALSKILTAFAIIFLIVGIAHACIKHHTNLKLLVKRVLEVCVIGVILVTPTIWGGIATFVATVVGDIVSYLSTIL